MGVVRVFAKQFGALVLIVGLIQLIRKLTLKDTSLSSSNFPIETEMVLSELESRISAVDGLVKTTTKMMQVQVEFLDKKMESESRALRPTIGSTISENFKDLTVADLIDHTTNQWDWNRIALILPSFEATIKRLPPPTARGEDRLVWLLVKSGEYTTRSGYGTIATDTLPAAQTQFNWQTNLWKLRTLPKIKNFLWKASKDALPVGIQLIIRHISPSMDCRRCGNPESTTHMLFHCPFALQVWNLAPISNGLIPHGASMLDALIKLRKATILPPLGIHSADLFSWICWHILKARNQLIFKDTHFSAIEIITKAIQEVF